MFLRARSDLSHLIQRIKLKGEGPRKPGNPDQEPDFYSMFSYLPPSCADPGNHHGLPRTGMPTAAGTPTANFQPVQKTIEVAPAWSLRRALYNAAALSQVPSGQDQQLSSTTYPVAMQQPQLPTQHPPSSAEASSEASSDLMWFANDAGGHPQIPEPNPVDESRLISQESSSTTVSSSEETTSSNIRSALYNSAVPPAQVPSIGQDQQLMPITTYPVLMQPQLLSIQQPPLLPSSDISSDMMWYTDAGGARLQLPEPTPIDESRFISQISSPTTSSSGSINRRAAAADAVGTSRMDDSLRHSNDRNRSTAQGLDSETLPFEVGASIPNSSIPGMQGWLLSLVEIPSVITSADRMDNPAPPVTSFTALGRSSNGDRVAASNSNSTRHLARDSSFASWDNNSLGENQDFWSDMG